MKYEMSSQLGCSCISSIDHLLTQRTISSRISRTPSEQTDLNSKRFSNNRPSGLFITAQHLEIGYMTTVSYSNLQQRVRYLFRRKDASAHSSLACTSCPLQSSSD